MKSDSASGGKDRTVSTANHFLTPEPIGLQPFFGELLGPAN